MSVARELISGAYFLPILCLGGILTSAVVSRTWEFTFYDPTKAF